jgi:hypothetical protein
VNLPLQDLLWELRQKCNKIIRVQAIQVKEEMEEPKEAAVNKREGRVNTANLKARM